MNNTLPTEHLLAHIRKHFYAPATSNPHYHRDRKMLLYTLTWPAQWMDQRGLPVPSQTYEKLLTERLDAIAKHGNPQHYEAHFPRYLLKCLQDWFAWHGDDLYDELKHIRNQLYSIDALLREQPSQNTEDIIPSIAAAHAILAVHYRCKKQPDPKQLTLL